MQIYVVQANARDHGGEVIKVTKHKLTAELAVRRHVIRNNQDHPAIDTITKDYVDMGASDFVTKYGGNAWVDSAFYTEHVIL